MKSTLVKDVMHAGVTYVSSKSTLKEAARKMKAKDCGVLPVGTEAKLIGIITDRDIVIRAVVEGKNINDELVESCMTKKIYECKEGDELSSAVSLMARYNVNRLVVRDENGKIAGMLTFGSILRKSHNPAEVGELVEQAVQIKAA